MIARCLKRWSWSAVIRLGIVESLTGAPGLIWSFSKSAQLGLAAFVQRTITCDPEASMIGVPPWLPLLVSLMAPETTAVSGTVSCSCSRRRRATTLRGLPRTSACDWTQSSRSPFASYVQAVADPVPAGTTQPLWALSSRFGSYEVASAPPLSRTLVFHVTFLSSSTLPNTAEPGLLEFAATRLSAFGQRQSAGEDEVQTAG